MTPTDITSKRVLEGRVALVTGASRGIGAATSRRLADEGAAVALAARDARRLSALAEEIELAGGRAYAHATDVASEDAVAALVEATVAELGRLDIAVNCAGASGAGKVSIEELDRGDFDRAIDVNLTAAYHCLRHEVPAILAGGRGGAIVNVSSGAGLRAGSDGIAPYVAAKHGLQGLTKAVALDVAARGIRVNAVAPGPIDTDMLAHGDEGAKRMAARWVPIGRVGRPEEVAEAIVWMCSDRASFVSGATLEIDGGMAARG